jgi:hypothetical protein
MSALLSAEKISEKQVINQYENTDAHTSIYEYILPIPMSKCQKENIAW